MKTKDIYWLAHPKRRIPAVLKHRKILGFLLLALFLLGLGSLGVAAPTPLRITLGTFSPYYSPELVYVGSGTPISWENPTANLHSITHDGCKSGERCAFDSGPIGPNGTFTVHDLPPGHYSYHCSFHPIMRGQIEVTEPATPTET